MSWPFPGLDGLPCVRVPLTSPWPRPGAEFAGAAGAVGAAGAFEGASTFGPDGPAVGGLEFVGAAVAGGVVVGDGSCTPAGGSVPVGTEIPTVLKTVDAAC